MTGLTVLAVMAVSVVTATPLKLNPPVSVFLINHELQKQICTNEPDFLLVIFQ